MGYIVLFCSHCNHLLKTEPNLARKFFARYVEDTECSKKSTCNCSKKLRNSIKIFNFHYKKDRSKRRAGFSGHEYMC